MRKNTGITLNERVSATDQVYDVLYRQILAVELVPGAKISEAEVAKRLGVSRQPVRDAFYRLSNLGLLQIRPQKATRVTKIRVQDILKARFVRTSMEIEVMRQAVETFQDEDFDALDALVSEQKKAIDQANQPLFLALDNEFHQAICQRANLGFAWDLIFENKAHMDRVRFLSSATDSHQAWLDHVEIVQLLRQRDTDAVDKAVRAHLSNIQFVIERLRTENHAWFSN